MKVTQVLQKNTYGNIFKILWMKKGKMIIPRLEVPPELQAMGVKIHDAKDVAMNRYNFDGGETATEVISLHDDENTKKFYVFDNTIQVTEKETQVAALTKTLCYEGLPFIYNSLIGAERIPNQDVLVQNAILQATVRDGQLVKLPKKVNPEKPMYTFPREYGICYERKSHSMMEKLAYLSDMGCGKYPRTLARWKITDAFSEVLVERNSSTVIYQMLSDFIFTADSPLKPFATPVEVETTKDTALPSIYPVKPTLDLTQMTDNPCKNREIDVLDADIARNQHVHTIHMIHKSYDEWFPVQELSRGIASCFSFAAEEAYMKYGLDVKILPTPIAVQCIFSNLQAVGFVAYQLNTLDLNDDDGVKNIAWYEGPYELYEEVDQINGVKGYNCEVFPKMLAFYLNGAHPSSW